jgi:uncharacterized protein
MNPKEKIDKEMISAAKGKDAIKLSAIRMIKSALHNKEIDARRELDESELLQVLSSLVKQRRESIEQFRAGGRADLVDKEEKELHVIQSFMPEQMSPDTIEVEVMKAIAETGASSLKDMGTVMKSLMPRITGKADGKIVSDIVKAKLSS